tara:strand:+ start:649 stop:873 length:225 start_codon:yes stop_codon:yes gene_type:complete
MRFVVALYSVLNTLSSPFATSDGPLAAEAVDGVMVEKDRRTRGESSASTIRVLSAMEASRAVGRGRSIVLETPN